MFTVTKHSLVLPVLHILHIPNTKNVIKSSIFFPISYIKSLLISQEMVSLQFVGVFVQEIIIMIYWRPF